MSKGKGKLYSPPKPAVEHLIHLHCKSNGKGEFVVHGFQIDNVFEFCVI